MKIKIIPLKYCASLVPRLARICYNTLGNWSPNTSFNETKLWFD